MTRFVRTAVASGAAAVALAAPATAVAEPPTATTNAAQNVTQTTATLRGTVNPRGNQTFSFFQYGTSKLYGATTPEVDRGKGNTAIKTSADITGLTPFTTYHYRVVAQTGQQLVFGRDQTFKTKRQPLGVTLGVTPGTVRPNGATTVAGNISGTGNAGQQVVLQANPFPFSGFFDLGNAQVADAAGNFSFPVLDVPVNTVFRVRLPDKPELVSPEITVSVKIDVHAKVPHKVRRGRKVTFRGFVTPSNPGAPVLIQRKVRRQWVTFKRAKLGDKSRYHAKLRVSRTGKYRVLVTPGPAYVSDTSAVKTIRVVRRKHK
jgi:hypothetical protein